MLFSGINKRKLGISAGLIKKIEMKSLLVSFAAVVVMGLWGFTGQSEYQTTTEELKPKQDKIILAGWDPDDLYTGEEKEDWSTEGEGDWII